MLFTVVKDFGDIWNRLFDHRPFLSGEIKYFIKEFEESRGDREIVKLADVGEWINDIQHNQISKACNAVDDLKKENILLDIALQTCDTILEGEENFDIDSLLASKRAIRKERLEKFENDLTEQYARVEKKFDDHEKDIISFYENLEKNLTL